MGCQYVDWIKGVQDMYQRRASAEHTNVVFLNSLVAVNFSRMTLRLVVSLLVS
jgi:hypothetical protein